MCDLGCGGQSWTSSKVEVFPCPAACSGHAHLLCPRLRSDLRTAGDESRSQEHSVLTRPLTRPIFTDFYRFVGLSWETPTIENYHSEDSRDSEGLKIGGHPGGYARE